MLDIKTLDKKKDIGRWILYDDGVKKEKGRLKSWNDLYLFVVFNCSDEWHRFQEYTAVPTNPKYTRFSSFEEAIIVKKEAIYFESEQKIDLEIKGKKVVAFRYEKHNPKFGEHELSIDIRDDEELTEKEIKRIKEKIKEEVI